MAYADQKMSGGKIVAIVIVALIHAALGYAFVTGLAYQYVKKAAEDMDVFDVEEPPPPPPDEPPPPPPDQPLPPPPVVSPPPIVQTPSPPIIMQTVTTPPPTITQPPIAAPAPPPPPRVSQAAKVRGNLGDFFTNDLYPDSARDAGVSGRVRGTLTIGADGRVSNCVVTGGSGSTELDNVTCRIARQRVRFTPAKDENGNPIITTYPLNIRWNLEE